MLVKFLSFVASVFGTARYKAIFLSCLAVVLSITGVTAVAVFKDGGTSHTAASTVDNPEEDEKKQDNNTPQLGGISSQSTKDADQTQTETTSPTTTNQNQSSGNTSSSTETKTEDVTISLSTDKLTLAAGALSEALTAAISDKSNVVWTVKPVNESDTGVKATISQNNTSVLSFQLEADADAKSGSVVHFTVTARDATRNINLSKQISVTIQ